MESIEQDEGRLITKRVIRLVYLAVITVGSGLLMGVCHRFAFEKELSLLFADVLFAALLVFYMEMDRLHRGKKPDTSEDFGRICLYFTVSIAVSLVLSFLPAYTSPVLAIGFLLTVALNREQALLLSVFLDAQLALVAHSSVEVLTCYLLLTILGTILVDMYGSWEYRRGTEALILLLSMAIPALFSYIELGMPKLLTFGLTILDGAVSVLAIHFLYEPLHFRQAKHDEISLDTIVDKNFHLVVEIKKYSQADYNHAIRVSRIAAHCAACIKANAKVAAVGGFYYRLGKLGGEPFIDSGVRLAENNCFPLEIISILSEYNGEQAPISTIESAIVHMTDALVKKFELLDRNTLSNSWNRDMVIYQTLNELSSSGIYDESGLTMNRYLKIREFLAKEETLL